jgi:hypothetical protein
MWSEAGVLAATARRIVEARVRAVARRGTRTRIWHQEQGQILPLLMVVMIALLAVGLLVFWLGFSTSVATNVQTAADAAALAGEQKVLTVLSTPLADGQLPTLADAVAQGCTAAQQYAADNKATVAVCEPMSSPQSTLGEDIEVETVSNQSMPQGSPGAGQQATAWARASTDAFSQSSPAVNNSTTASCDASLVSAPPFTPHGGRYGFFPSDGTNYSYGCESRIAGSLDQLAVAQHLHLVGVSGYVGSGPPSTTDPTTSAHACGAVSETQGLAHVSSSTLAHYKLIRPFPGRLDQIELSGAGCVAQTTTSSDASSQGPVGLGNTNVHLVPLSGGPAGSALLVAGVGVGVGEAPLQVGCQIYAVWKGLAGKNQKILLIALMVAEDESAMGQNTGGNTTDPGASVGVFQQIEQDGWGTIPEELNVTTAAEMFLIGAHNANGSPHGLLYYYGLDPSAPTWQLAQQTQGSGAGQSSGGLANYGAPANVAAAQAMLGQVTGGACKGVHS